MCHPEFTGFDASLRMLSVSARPDPRSAAAIRRSGGPTAHGSELGKAAFHWVQIAGEESGRLRSASRTATGPGREAERPRSVTEVRDWRSRDGLGGSVSAWAEKGPVQTLNLLLSVAQRG